MKRRENTDLLKLARTPFFFTPCNILNQRLKMSDAQPNFCSILRVSAAL